MIDVVVLGQSLPSLQAALDCASLGLSVLVIGERVDEPTQPLRDSAGAIADLAAQLATPLPAAPSAASSKPQAAGPSPTRSPSTVLHTMDPAPPLLRNRAGTWSEQNEPNVWGIPSVPLAETTRAILGSGGAFRAYLDRVTPILTIGQTQTIGTLVKKRIGKLAHNVLVEPQLWERYGVDTQRIDVAIAAPGLNETMSRLGSLTGAALAYADRHARQEHTVTPAGGWSEFFASLAERLRLYSVEFSGETIVTVRERHDADGVAWVLTSADGREIEAQSIIADVEDSASQAALHELFQGLRGEPYRVHAEIDIDAADADAINQADAGGVQADSAQAGSSDDHAAAASASAGRDRLTRGDGWAIRILPSHRAQLVGPRVDAEAGFDEAAVADRVREAVASAGFSPRTDAMVRLLRKSAPFVSASERDAARLRVELFVTEHPTLLPVGEALTGGDASAAIAAAHRGAVGLRRRILGLSDEPAESEF